jgi:hypothetical protein
MRVKRSIVVNFGYYILQKKSKQLNFIILFKSGKNRINKNFAVKILWLLLQFHLLCSLLLQPEINTISARISNTNAVSFQINSNEQLRNRSNKNRTFWNYLNF